MTVPAVNGGQIEGGERFLQNEDEVRDPGRERVVSLANSGLDEKAPPVLTDGTFWHPPADKPEKTTVEGEGGGEKPAAKPAGGGGGGAKPPAKPQGRPLPGGKKK